MLQELIIAILKAGLPVGLASYVLIDSISLDMFIGLFVDALMNFVVAIAWPAYWISSIGGDRIWIWFAVAYGGYWVGVRFAVHQMKHRNEENG